MLWLKWTKQTSIVHPNRKEYTFFSAFHGTFSKNDHILVNKQTSIDTKNWNNSVYLIRSPWLKMRIQQQHKSRKPTNTWKLNIVHLNHQWVKEEIKGEVKDFLKINENDHTIYPNLWDTMKVVLTWKFIAPNANIKKLEKFHSSELTDHLKTSEQKEANSSKRIRWWEQSNWELKSTK